MALIGTVGSKGEQVNLLITKGDTFGPHQVTLQNPDETAFNLTGCTLSAVMGKYVENTGTTTAFTINVTNAAGGIFTFSLAKEVTATLQSNVTSNDKMGTYSWQLKLTDSTGKRIPIFYGEANVIYSLL